MDLSHYLRILRAHWIAIVVIILAGGAVSWGWALLQPKTYSADASGTIVVATSSGDIGSQQLGQTLAVAKASTYVQWAQSRPVASYVIDHLGLTVSPEKLIDSISVSNPTQTPIIKVTAQASTPVSARDLATTWIEGLAHEGEVQQGSAASQTIGLKTIESAALPESPSFPNPRLAIVIGLLVGLIVGIGYALVRSIFDKRIRRADALEAEFGLSVVGTVPMDKNFTDVRRIVDDGEPVDVRGGSDDLAVSEAMRELRSNLQFMDVDNPPRVIVVSSPLPGDGKSTVAANLAITLAAAGQRVVIVDGDLRRPTVAKTFNVVPGVGLTDVLVGRAELVDVLQPWGESGRLLVLGAGASPPNPSEMLGSKAMQTLLHDLSAEAFVLIDAPPLIPVTDAAVLAKQADGAVIVVSAGKTTTDALRQAIGNLGRVHGRTLGVILNRVPRRGPNSQYYGYHYSSYAPRPEQVSSASTGPAPALKAGGPRRSRGGGINRPAESLDRAADSAG